MSTNSFASHCGPYKTRIDANVHRNHPKNYPKLGNNHGIGLGYQEHSFSRLFVPKTLRSHDETFVL